MSKDVSIEEVKTVAKFMGMAMEAPDVWADTETGTIRILGEYRPYSDWNELMDVVDKIEKNTALSIIFNNWVNSGQYQCNIYKCFDTEANRERGLIVNKVGLIKKEVVWKAVVEYIKYQNQLLASYGYNQNKTP